MSNVTQITALFEKYPRFIRTRNGITIDSSLDIWDYCDKLTNVRLDFFSLPVSDKIRKSIKSTFIWYAENKSPDYLHNILTYLSYMLKYFNKLIGKDVSHISCEMLISYRSSLVKRKEYYLGYITGFLRKWFDLHYPGVSKDVIQYIEATTLAGNPKGEAVRTQDPNRGPFSEVEFQGINSAIRVAYKKGKICLQDFLLIWLLIARGHRPIQYAALKVSDFITHQNGAGDTIYLLYIPRAKQPDSFVRDSFKVNKIISKIGLMFAEHIRKLLPLARQLGVAHDDMPIFPRTRARLGAPVGYAWHHTRNSLSAHIKYVLNAIQLISERTGKPLTINPQRFRYTLGSRMAAEGHRQLVIAEALDHTTADEVSVYIENNPLIIKHIDEAMALTLAPLAKSFLGEIIVGETEATLANEVLYRISDPRFDPTLRPMGSCIQPKLCSAMTPLECYLCLSFQAWQNGPHKAVLDYLCQERERHVKRDLRIASNYDRLILAVGDVVDQCQNLQAGDKGKEIDWNYSFSPTA